MVGLVAGMQKSEGQVKRVVKGTDRRQGGTQKEMEGGELLFPPSRLRQ